MPDAAVAHAIVAALSGSRPAMAAPAAIGADLAVPDWTVIAAAVVAGASVVAVALARWRRPRRPGGDPAEAEAIAAALERRALRQGRILPDGDSDGGGRPMRPDADDGAGRTG
jgi:hypothetical protein